jgi:hypothetical protein
MKYWPEESLKEWYILAAEVSMEYAKIRGNNRYISRIRKKVKNFKDLCTRGASRNRILQIIYNEILTGEKLNLNVHKS